jgi:protein-S-isoprenylcysteine O-methyltransferase Ste14
MLDFAIVGFTILCLATLDIALHIYLDSKKIRSNRQSTVQASEFAVPSLALGAAGISTLLSFFLVLFLIMLWLGILNPDIIQILIPVIDPPYPIWMCGLVILSSGIILHGWSRLVRLNMASSWQMTRNHRLVTSGPYSRIRHPSYLSYMICFVGFVLMIPSVVTLILLFGIPGYYYIAKIEEKHLLHHFGKEYSEYMQRTGMLLPKIRYIRNKTDSHIAC